MLGLRFCARAFSSCGKRGPLFIAVRGPLTIVASLVAEQRLQTRRLSSCGPRAQLLRGTWDPPRPGLEPASPALAGRLLTTAPPGKPHRELLKILLTDAKKKTRRAYHFKPKNKFIKNALCIMAKIWKVAHLKMETFSVKVLMITVIVMTTAKIYWVRHWAKHPTWIILLNSHKSFMW